MGLRNVLVKTAAAAAIAGGLVAATASPASAYVVCNRWGHCWNTWHRYYPPYYGAYYGPYPYYDPYYRPYYDGPYYGGPAVTFGFNFGGGHWHGGHHH
jgi:hypothetical protein